MSDLLIPEEIDKIKVSLIGSNLAPKGPMKHCVVYLTGTICPPTDGTNYLCTDCIGSKEHFSELCEYLLDNRLASKAELLKIRLEHSI